MEDRKRTVIKKENLAAYLILLFLIWVATFIILKLLLQPYSVAYQESGILTVGYVLYAIIGMLFTTPAPFVTVLILALCKDKIGIRELIKRIFYTPNKKRTILITLLFCVIALIFALINGTPNGEQWYMLPLGFLVMIPFVGIAEEVGWRGFLQPVMEQKLKFPFSVLLVAVIWYVWHLDLWLDPTSNHYGDSLIGFFITIVIWSFSLAAIYKATNSIIACAIYHAFIDSIGAIYDWNLLFDIFPGNLVTNIYRVLWLAISICVWKYAEKQ